MSPDASDASATPQPVLRLPYLAELPLRVGRIADSWRQLQAGTAPPAALLKLHHNLQGLSATSAALGMAELTAASAAFEGVLVTALDCGMPSAPEEVTAAQALLEAVQRACASLNIAARGDGGPPSDLPGRAPGARDGAAQSAAPRAAAGQAHPGDGDGFAADGGGVPTTARDGAQQSVSDAQFGETPGLLAGAAGGQSARATDPEAGGVIAPDGVNAVLRAGTTEQRAHGGSATRVGEAAPLRADGLPAGEKFAPGMMGPALPEAEPRVDGAHGAHFSAAAAVPSAVRADGPAVETAAVRAEGPAIETGAVRAEGPFVETAAVRAEGPFVETAAVRVEGSTVETAAVRADDSAVETAGARADGQGVEKAGARTDGQGVDALLPAGGARGEGLRVPESDSARGTGALAERRHVALLTTDQRLANEVTIQLRNFGFSVERLGTTSELQAAMRRNPPAALILDTLSPESAEEELHHIPEIRRALAGQIPVLLISVQDGVTAHLHAVRAGSQAYFVKPVDMHALIYTLERLTSRQPPEPYRILIVDDELKAAERHAQVLRADGMSVTLLSDPLQTIETIRAARPDLVLMDLHMPQCSGLELAEVLRRQTAFVSLPIIFLAAPHGLLKRLDVLRLGDDFLTKPVEPRLLLSVVTNRAERSRQLRALMDRDSLTGLLNHTRTKEQLNLEVLRAERQEQPLALALIDLDRFKTVNDRFGHATGDRVLMSLAHLLRRHLRKTDLIGRYGGEEFAAIFPNTSGANAVHAMEQIREAFARVRHRSDAVDFLVTLSAGIAEYPAAGGPAALTDAADKALYAAKRGGRNQVVLSLQALK